MKKGFSLKSIGKVEKNVDASIQLHKLIDSGDEQGAINLINSEKGIDVSYEYNQRIPAFSAINSNMYDLFEVIVNHPTLLQLLCLQYLENQQVCLNHLFPN
jgi:hypothetical protein